MGHPSNIKMISTGCYSLILYRRPRECCFKTENRKQKSRSDAKQWMSSDFPHRLLGAADKRPGSKLAPDTCRARGRRLIWDRAPSRPHSAPVSSLPRPPGRAAGLVCLRFSVCKMGVLSVPASLGAQRPLSGPTCSPVCSPRLSGAWRNPRVHGTQKTMWRRTEEGGRCVYGLSLPQKVSPAG